MITHNFKLINADTDSITIGKPDGTSFSEQERIDLLNEINNILPEKIIFADDGYFSKVVILKAKNYILYDGKKIKKKGSSLKSSKIEKGLSDLMNQVIDALVFDKQNTLLDIYHKFIIEVNNVQDINRWTKKLTVTEKVLNPERKNEQKPYDAIKGKGLQQGDKFWVYETKQDTMKLANEWDSSNPDVDVEKLMKRVYSTLTIFKNVIDITQFPKYHLKNKKIKEQLQEILK